MPTCIFAMAGSENAGLVAAETKNPRRSVPKAVASIWIRLSLFYIMGSLIVTINVSPLNEDIFGGSGTNASPFVIMYRQAGVMPLAHIMNAVIFISVLSTGTISGFAGSRTLLGLSQIGMAPRVSPRSSFSLPVYSPLTQSPDNAKSRQNGPAMVRSRPDPPRRRRPGIPQCLIR
jgi:amino acid transporter